jgi:hypothetical protein
VDIVATILIILIALAGSLVVAIIMWGVLIAVDSWFRPSVTSAGRIVDKEFTPAYFTTILVDNIPQLIYHGDSWRLLVQVGHRCDWISVSERYYNSRKVGNEVRLTYVNGRFSNNMYARSVA